MPAWEVHADGLHAVLITESQLDEWVRGNSQNAQGIVVELVWRLVAASCPRPRRRRFPLGDSVGQHGADGILEVDLPFKPFVQEGVSYWEVGTGVDAGGKATEVYSSLTSATPQEERLRSTFVFVTPLSGRRDWQGTWKDEAQLAWTRKRKAEGQWKDVLVLDGTQLVDWISHFLPVEL